MVLCKTENPGDGVSSKEPALFSPEIVYTELFTSQRLGHGSKHYDIWKLKINFILSSKGISHVLHHPQPPLDDPATHHLREKWFRDDAMCQHLIRRALEDHNAFFSYREKHTAKSMLDALESQFNSNHSNPPSEKHIINLCRTYVTRRMSDVSSIGEHVLEMRAASRELEVAGVKVSEEMQAVVLMNSLPESLDDVACMLNLLLGMRKEKKLGFDNVSQWLRVAAEMRPRWVRGGGAGNGSNAGYGECCCLCGRQGHSLYKCLEDQSTEQDWNSGNKIPFFEDGMNFFEMQYHNLKMSERLNYTGKEFTSWKFRLSMALPESGVEYVLRHPKPSEPTKSTPEEDVKRYTKWLADDFTCRHLILGAMDDNLLRYFHNQPTAKALMDKLNDWFDFPSLGRRIALFRNYVECRMFEGTKINDHIYKMSRMVEELNKAGIEVPDEIQASVLINSLPMSLGGLIMAVKMHVDREINDGMKLLDSVIRSVKVADKIPPLKVNRKSNYNYQREPKNRRYK